MSLGTNAVASLFQDEGGVIVFGIDERKGFEVVGVYDAQDLQKRYPDVFKPSSDGLKNWALSQTD